MIGVTNMKKQIDNGSYSKDRKQLVAETLKTINWSLGNLRVHVIGSPGGRAREARGGGLELQAFLK